MRDLRNAQAGVCRRFIVRGRVQGVGFRWFVQEIGRNLELCGWVRNLSDGSVEVLAQGGAVQIEELARRLAQGTPQSRVEGVEEFAGESGGPSPFAIR